MISKADYQDIEQIANMATDFFGNALDAVGLFVEYADVFDFVYAMIEREDMEMFVSKEGDDVTGIIGGHVHPWPFNKNIMVLEEIVWFVPEKNRDNPISSVKLFNKLLKWGKEKGATTLIVSSNVRAESERVCAFYERMGVRMTDKTFMGRL